MGEAPKQKEGKEISAGCIIAETALFHIASSHINVLSTVSMAMERTYAERSWVLNKPFHQKIIIETMTIIGIQKVTTTIILTIIIRKIGRRRGKEMIGNINLNNHVN